MIISSFRFRAREFSMALLRDTMLAMSAAQEAASDDVAAEMP